MKPCKGNCGKKLGLLGGDYCKECYKRLSLRDKVIEDLKLKYGYTAPAGEVLL